jgi:hypothetical protein
MTNEQTRDEEYSDRWLAERHPDLLDGLGRLLDIEAGLREVMLHGEHTDLVDALGSTLDTEAGLAAITAPQGAAAAPPRTKPQQGKSSLPGPADAAAAIAAAHPAARMALRRNPLIQVVIISDLLIRALTIAAKVTDYFVLPSSHHLDQAREMARDLVSDLALARAHARVRYHPLAFTSALNRARDLRHNIGHNIDLDLDLDLAVARDLARDLALARALVRDLAHVGDLDRTLALARDLDLNIARNLDHDRSFDRDLDRRATGLARALSNASELAHHAAFRVCQVLGIQRVDGLAAALLDGALDDFTHADLADVNLSGIDLTGVRWSEAGTVWPPRTDLQALRARSREVEPGVYEITRRGDGRKAPDRVRV